MKHYLLTAMVWIAISYSAQAQQVIRGLVISGEDKQPLVGANILLQGAKGGVPRGTVTDAEGKYSLSTVAGDSVLIFSFTGMVTERVKIKNNTTIDVTLVPDFQTLADLVVVGYGTQQRQDVTGAISVVKGKDIQNIPVVSVESAIQGRTAGVQINSGSGKLGQGISVRVRGAASVTAGSQPLYVVDGIPITTQIIGSNEGVNPLADINPNDIESFEVLKDASAAAIYGSRASNGVVLITTKSGKSGKTQVNLNYYTGTSKPTYQQEWLNGTQYLELITEAMKNAGASTAKIEERLDKKVPGWRTPANSDWQSEAFQTGKVSQYDLSASGGNDKTRFYIGGSYLNQEGIIISNAYNRFSGRVNIDHNVNAKLKIGANLSLSRSENKRVPYDNAFSNPLQLVAIPNVQPIRNTDGTINANTLYYNALISVRDAYNTLTSIRNLSNVYASYEFTKGLVFKSELGLDMLDAVENSYQGKETYYGTPSGLGTYATNRIINYTTNNYLTYSRSINQHTFDVVGGMSYQQADEESSEIQGRNFANSDLKNLASALQITLGTAGATGFRLLSYFARANYKFNNKYLLSLSGRYDASTRFGKDTRYGFFPAASIGWLISEEDFLKSNTLVSLLKVRLSYGRTGNSDIDNFASRGLYGSAFYGDRVGLSPLSIENKRLTWETSDQLDLGFDFGLFRNRISGTVDVYNKKTSGLLLNRPLPGTSGYTDQYQNVGNMENKGIEFTINTQNLVGDFKWSTSFNITRNLNKITYLGGVPLIPGGGRSIAVAKVGEALGTFYTKKYAGVDQANGDALYYLKEGSSETTNDYSAAELQVVGNPNPDFYGGISNNFSYKGIDFTVLGQFVSGNDLYNTAGIFQSVNGDYYDNQTIDQLARWQKPGDITNIPQARFDKANGTQASSRWVSDGSYFRVKTVTLGYSLPKALISRIHVSNLRVYTSAQNLFTFTGYKGWDPEVNSLANSNISQGMDFYTPPQAKTIIFGVNIGF